MVNIFGESINIEEVAILSETDVKQICIEQNKNEQDKYGVILLDGMSYGPVPFNNQYIKGFLFPFTTK